jgi:fumarate hydratase class I
VEDVYLEEFGSPEAIWSLRVEDFPVIVTMDSHGNSLHEVVQKDSLEKLKAALRL